ncbi:hypothetical protein [Mucilaginibacter lappiensis]|uniref:hypothetical protein n=1 Tax=Mucilaginibacter lappiensis TaxID=354630 RepID=UPI003D1F8467
MESEYFEAFWWPSGQGGKGKLLAYDKQFYICLKLSVTFAKPPTLVFCRSGDLEWDDQDMGYVISFDKSFFTKGVWCKFEGIDLFKERNPINIELDEADVLTLAPIFDKICGSMDSTYLYKYDLVRTYLFQIIHLSIKIHLQRTDIVKLPIRYARLTTCGIDMFIRIKLGHKQ